MIFRYSCAIVERSTHFTIQQNVRSPMQLLTIIDIVLYTKHDLDSRRYEMSETAGVCVAANACATLKPGFHYPS